MHHITASTLYNYVTCPHRVWRDVNGPQEEKSQEVNPFVELLWQKGVKHESKIIENIGEFANLSSGDLDDRFQRTIEAMKNGVSLIYQGVLRHNNLLGIPDILRKLEDNTYEAIDIKSGSAFADASESEEDEDGKPKKHYAVQLCLYNDILKNLGFSKLNQAKIIDSAGKEIVYNFENSINKVSKQTWLEVYHTTREDVEALINNLNQNKPAISGACKLCPWYNSCKTWCNENMDLTNIFSVGRSFRDVVERDLGIKNVEDFLKIDVEEIMDLKEREKKSGKKEFLYRVGESTLTKAIKRGNILYKTKKPEIYQKIEFPEVKYELFLDIEDDPTQEFVYMHGIVERVNNEERFIHFTAKEISREAEKKAWEDLWRYLKSLPQDNFSVYYYSPHEKTTYKKLAKLYPEVISLEEVEDFFANPKVIDLYQVITKYSDWPVSSYSIKGIATYLGFQWRDETPSGALSIQWFNEYIEKNDEKLLERILEYNEDDCKATRILKDGITTISNNIFLS